MSPHPRCSKSGSRALFLKIVERIDFHDCLVCSQVRYFVNKFVIVAPAYTCASDVLFDVLQAVNFVLYK